MWLITKKRLLEFSDKHPAAKPAVRLFIERIKNGCWETLQDVRDTFPHADPVIVASGKKVLVFNMGGNDYRVITDIPFPRKCVYILAVLTHAEYDKEKWKNSL
jgi:mRNA interferase HigB